MTQISTSHSFSRDLEDNPNSKFHRIISIISINFLLSFGTAYMTLWINEGNKNGDLIHFLQKLNKLMILIVCSYHIFQFHISYNGNNFFL